MKTKPFRPITFGSWSRYRLTRQEPTPDSPALWIITDAETTDPKTLRAMVVSRTVAECTAFEEIDRFSLTHPDAAEDDEAYTDTEWYAEHSQNLYR
jgi:hypothetical protein